MVLIRLRYSCYKAIGKPIKIFPMFICFTSLYFLKSKTLFLKITGFLSVVYHRFHPSKPALQNRRKALSHAVFSASYQNYALHMGRVDGIDVCGSFFVASVRGNMSIGFSVIFEKTTFKETYQMINMPISSAETIQACCSI